MGRMGCMLLQKQGKPTKAAPLLEEVLQAKRSGAPPRLIPSLSRPDLVPILSRSRPDLVPTSCHSALRL